MPIYQREDSNGHYYQYGNHGAKYYFIVGNAKSQTDAYDKAKRQTAAIHASEYRRAHNK